MIVSDRTNRVTGLLREQTSKSGLDILNGTVGDGSMSWQVERIMAVSTDTRGGNNSMKIQGSSLRFMKTLHIIAASVWFGGTVCIGKLAFDCFFSYDREYFLATAPLIPWLYGQAILYFALATLISGIIYGAFTHWGFFKHRWITLKWILTIILIPCVGIGTIGQLFALLGRLQNQDFQGGFADGGIILFFITVQIIIMTFMIELSVFKWGKKSTEHKGT